MFATFERKYEVPELRSGGRAGGGGGGGGGREGGGGGKGWDEEELISSFNFLLFSISEQANPL